MLLMAAKQSAAMERALALIAGGMPVLEAAIVERVSSPALYRAMLRNDLTPFGKHRCPTCKRFMAKEKDKP